MNRTSIACVVLAFVLRGANAEQIASDCRITAVDVTSRTVTLTRMTASGEKTGRARVADDARITVDGKSAALDSLVPPVSATVTYDTESKSLVAIQAKSKIPRSGNEPPRAVAPFDSKKAKEYQEAWAKHLGVSVVTTNSIGMKLILIPPGEFDMGSSQTEIDELVREAKEKAYPSWYAERIPAEGPRHRVRITRPFYLAQHEVTVGRFKQFVTQARHTTSLERAADSAGTGEKAAGKLPKGNWRSPGFTQSDDHPVMLVDWSDANAFCEWLGRKETATYRLPTEAQWEFACRAGTAEPYYFGRESAALSDHAWFGAGAARSPHPVGKKQPNPWRLHDMYGNVSEWCADWFQPNYSSATGGTDPVAPDTGDSRVVRGGEFYASAPSVLRSACRGDHRGPRHGCGFRVVCEVGAWNRDERN